MLPMERRPCKELMFYMRLYKATEDELAIMSDNPKAFFHDVVSAGTFMTSSHALLLYR